MVTTVLSDTMRSPSFSQQLNSQNVLDGEQVVLGCVVTGVPAPTIKWYHNDEPAEKCDDFVITHNPGTGRCELVIVECFPEDSGTYRCVASNPVGEISSMAVLDVSVPSEGVSSASDICDYESGQSDDNGVNPKIVSRTKRNEALSVLVDTTTSVQPAEDAMTVEHNIPIQVLPATSASNTSQPMLESSNGMPSVLLGEAPVVAMTKPVTEEFSLAVDVDMKVPDSEIRVTSEVDLVPMTNPAVDISTKEVLMEDTEGEVSFDLVGERKNCIPQSIRLVQDELMSEVHAGVDGSNLVIQEQEVSEDEIVPQMKGTAECRMPDRSFSISDEDDEVGMAVPYDPTFGNVQPNESDDHAKVRCQTNNLEDDIIEPCLVAKRPVVCRPNESLVAEDCPMVMQTNFSIKDIVEPKTCDEQIDTVDRETIVSSNSIYIEQQPLSVTNESKENVVRVMESLANTMTNEILSCVQQDIQCKGTVVMPDSSEKMEPQEIEVVLPVGDEMLTESSHSTMQPTRVISGTEKPNVPEPLHSSTQQMNIQGDLPPQEIKVDLQSVSDMSCLLGSSTGDDMSSRRSSTLMQVEDDNCVLETVDVYEEVLQETQHFIPAQFQQPIKPQIVHEGETARFTALFIGTPAPEISWMKDHTHLELDGRIQAVVDLDVRSCSLIISGSRMEDFGNYTCQALNPVGRATCTANLVVVRKYNQDQQKQLTTSHGVLVVLICLVFCLTFTYDS